MRLRPGVVFHVVGMRDISSAAMNPAEVQQQFTSIPAFDMSAFCTAGAIPPGQKMGIVDQKILLGDEGGGRDPMPQLLADFGNPETERMKSVRTCRMTPHS